MSTSAVATDCSQYISDTMDDGHIVVYLFLDYAEALDCVDLSMLIWKMYAFGARGQTSKWFQTQSLREEQCVFLNRVTAPLCYIYGGIHQASILGSVLFQIFYNDLFQISYFSSNSHLLLTVAL